MRGGVRTAALLALGVVLTGCSHDDNAVGSTTAKPPWDACSLSDAALQKAGVDPASKETGLLGTEIPNSTTCRWRGKDYNVTLTASSTLTLEQAKQDGSGFTDVTVSGRPATTFHTGSGDPNKDCFLVIPFQSGGLALLQASQSSLSLDRTPACESATRVGDALASAMPR